MYVHIYIDRSLVHWWFLVVPSHSVRNVFRQKATRLSRTLRLIFEKFKKCVIAPSQDNFISTRLARHLRSERVCSVFESCYYYLQEGLLKAFVHPSSIGVLTPRENSRNGCFCYPKITEGPFILLCVYVLIAVMSEHYYISHLCLRDTCQLIIDLKMRNPIYMHLW